MPRGLRSLKSAKKDLDALCRQVVFARDKICQHCGKTSNLQWAHIRSRRYLSTRWHLCNSLCLCAGCHLWWHHEPLEATEWFRTKFRERAQVLRVIEPRKADAILTRLYLEQQLVEFGG